MAKETTRNGVIGVSLVVGALLFVVTLVWLRSYFEVAANREIYTKVLSLESTALRDLRAQETETLNTYGWVDRDKNKVRIPIDRAMELMVKDARRRSPGRSGGE